MNASRWTTRLHRLRPLLMLGVGGLLLYQLSEIGWRQIAESIPTTPWFYLLFLVGYAVLPLSEVALYGRVWKFRFREGYPVFFLKRVYNQDVLDYSGDVSLLVWARGRFGFSDGDLARVIKDHSLLSALSGHVVALAFPMFCFVGATPESLAVLAEYRVPALFAGLGAAPLLGAGAYGVRRRIFFLSDRELLFAAALHGARIVVALGVLLLQWAVVMPEQSWHVLFVLLTTQCLVGRLPTFLGRDFLIVSAGLAASQQLGVPAGTAAGVLLVNGVLDKLLNATIFLVASIVRGRSKRSPQSAATAAATNEESLHSAA